MAREGRKEIMEMNPGSDGRDFWVVWSDDHLFSRNLDNVNVTRYESLKDAEESANGLANKYKCNAFYVLKPVSIFLVHRMVKGV